MTSNLHTFSTPADLAAALASEVAAKLSAAIAARGSASIAVSGGSTPKAFFEALSGKVIDWSKVTVTLVDERFVPADNARSNHLLVATHLLKDKASAASFIPLYYDRPSIKMRQLRQQRRRLRSVIRSMSPFSAWAATGIRPRSSRMATIWRVRSIFPVRAAS